MPKAGAAGGDHEPPRHTGVHAPEGAVALAFVVLLLILATTSQGAFAVSRWAPLALLTLAVLVGAVVLYGRIPLLNRRVAVALAGIWGLAAWAMLSMVWAQSKGDAWVAAQRGILYAAVVTVPFVMPMSRRTLARAGWAVAVGIGLVGLYTLIRLLSDGSSIFLAGRLNGPINYRNATAVLFALPVWPMVIAAASRDSRRIIRASALSLATLCLGLAFLTQSRGILIGLAVGAVVALSLGPERVRRVWTAVLVVGGVAAAAHWLLRPYHAFNGGSGFVTSHDIAVAAQALAAATVVAFFVGLLVALFDAGLRPGSPRVRQVHQAARIALVVAILLAIGGGLAATGNPVTYARQKWDEFRSTNGTASTDIRLLSTGGQRYDLWRVALKEFGSAPVIGVGADNYQFGYYRYRRTNRNLDAPHSLIFGLLAETGLVGLALFVLFLGGLAATMRSRWRLLAPGARRDAVAPAAAGAVMVGQATVDWIWLIPGLTAIGLFMLAIAAAQVAASDERRLEAGSRPLPRLLRVAVAVPLVGAGLCVLSLYLSDAYIQRARSVTSNPSAELSAARTAGRFDPWSVTPHYLQASAYETMGNRPQAYAQLRDALSLEPKNAATLGVLGDFEARGGNVAAARGYYRRALALNPLDTGLQQLARIGLRAKARQRAAR